MKNPARPTVHDIAKSAGVSLATVDRVLNERPGVREKTIERVNAAVSELGYVRDMAAANLAKQRDYRFHFVLPEPTNSFLRELHGAIEDAGRMAAQERMSIRIDTVPAGDPHAIALALGAFQDVDGVAVMARETPQVRDALGRLHARNVAVATFISDLPSSCRSHFAGIDDIAAGRTAALLMGRFLSGRRGEVLVVAGSMMARDQIARRFGFDQVIAEEFPDLEVLPSIETWDRAEDVAAAINRALERKPDVIGVYAIGAGASGLVRALSKRKEKPVAIVHEISDATREGLRGRIIDAVIAQDVRHVVRSALRVLRAKCDGRLIVPSQERIRIEIVLRENLQ